MAYIKEEEINELRKNTDIVNIISSYIPLTKKGKNYFGVCPFHDDHSPSMSVSPEQQIWKCFTCKEGGNVFSFVEKYENISYPEAITLVAQKTGFHLSNSYEKKKDNKHSKYYEMLELVNKYYQNNLKTSLGVEAKKYLLNRKISESVISDFGIGLAIDDKDKVSKLLISKGYSDTDIELLGIANNYSGTLNDHLTGRIIFPLANSSGEVIGFTGRIYRNEDKNKYLNTKETPIYKKGNMLYNYHLAKTNSRLEKCIIVVEGQMDAIRLYSEGFKNVVATSGTSLTKEQIELLKQLKCPIILCLDNDTAGANATYAIGEDLINNNATPYVIRLSDAKDPDEYLVKFGADKFNNLYKSPMKFFDFKLNYLKQNKDMNNSVDLAKYINEVINNLNNEKDEILREITINKLSEDYNLDIEVLKSKLKSNIKETVIKEKPPAKKIVLKKNKYDKACEEILYMMMNDSIYLKIYQNHLGYIPIEKYRNVANEALYYYKLNKTINLADFITFVSEKNNILSVVNEIINNSFDDIMNEKEMEQCIKIIKELITKNEIEKLKKDMLEETDINKKMKIASKIANIKKGSVEDND